MNTQLEKANKILGTNYNNWYKISKYEFLTEDFIREFQNKVDWGYISAHQKLSENFIREFHDKVNWVLISECQKLSENFIKEFKDKVDWKYISECQKLSESFIREFKDSVSWICISECQDISDSFIEEFKDKINKTFLKRNEYIKNRNKVMTKKDLKPGHIVELRDGARCLVIMNDENLFLINETRWNDLLNYDENLTNVVSSNLDIIKIYEFTKGGLDMILQPDNHKLIWERKEVKEVTMDQVAKAFGTTTDKLRIKK